MHEPKSLAGQRGVTAMGQMKQRGGPGKCDFKQGKVREASLT